jgi:phosphohistidine swiveling domain-containing protein
MEEDLAFLDLETIDLLSTSHDEQTVRSRIGNKAYNLFILHKNGFHVPPFFVATTELFERANKIDLDISKGLSVLVEKYRECYGVKKWIVRSSSLIEDSRISFAGIFSSYPYCTTVESISECLKKIFCAMDNELIISILERCGIPQDLRKIACIIQEQLDPNSSGVLFTADPVNSDREKTIVEVTDGPLFLAAHGKREYVLDKRTLAMSASFSEREESNLTALYQNARDIEALMGCPQDIEFAFQDDTLYILQTRPITTLKEDHSRKTLLLRERNLQKEIASRCGWNIAPMTYIDFPPRLDSSHVAALIEDFIKKTKSGYVFIYDYSEHTFDLINKDQVQEYLSKKRGHYRILELEEFINTKYVGRAQLDGNGNIKIHYIRGDILGLNRGFINPSRCTIMRNGTKHCTHTIQREMFDPINREVRPVHAEISLPLEVLEEIGVLTSQFTQQYGPCIVEWSCDDNHTLYFFDADRLRPGSSSSVCGNAPSLGHATGICHRIEVDENQSLVQSAMAKDLSNIAHTLGSEDCILVASKPLIPFIWLALKKNVRGFIFKEASSLCHLAILLREMNIPAIVDEELYEEIDNGDLVEIDFRKVLVSKRRENRRKGN